MGPHCCVHVHVQQDLEGIVTRVYQSLKEADVAIAADVQVADVCYGGVWECADAFKDFVSSHS